MAKFKAGQWVTWTSQSGSYSKTKIGQIVEVVNAGDRPISPSCNDWAGGTDGLPRNHESYIVLVTRSSKAKPRWYWPRMAHLKKASKPKKGAGRE